MKKWGGPLVETGVGTGAGVKYLSDRSAKAHRREVRRVRLKKTKDLQMFVHSALEDGQTKDAILQDLEITKVKPGARENLTLEVQKYYTDCTCHISTIGDFNVPFVGRLGFGQQIWTYQLIEKNPAIVNDNINQATTIGFPAPKVKAQKLSMQEMDEFANFHQSGSVNIDQKYFNFFESIIPNHIKTKQKEFVTSVGEGRIISQGSFIKERSELGQSIAVFLIFSLIGVPILDMIQRFVRNRIFPRIPILKNYSGKNSELLQVEERLKVEILNSSQLQLNRADNFNNYKKDIISLIYLLEKDKITKKEAFKIFKNKHSLYADLCETLLFKKEGLLQIETDILSSFEKFYE